MLPSPPSPLLPPPPPSTPRPYAPIFQPPAFGYFEACAHPAQSSGYRSYAFPQPPLPPPVPQRSVCPDPCCMPEQRSLCPGPCCVPQQHSFCPDPCCMPPQPKRPRY
ncbi:hypothetical protein GGH95_006848 [Coemansia sp. RSA 1836]|nr:hypothetical protein GGH95_006848 [Coemansia sp. RSA 1836]